MDNNLEMEIIEIPLSKVKLITMVVISILFVVMSSYILFSQRVSIVFNSHLFNTAAGIVGIIFFGMVFITILSKLIKNYPGIIIDKIGITVSSGPGSYGLVKWEDITNIRTVLSSGQKYLLIIVKNPNYYIAMQGNMLVKKLMEMNTKKFETPMLISANVLKCNFEQLKNIIVTKFNENNELGFKS